MLNYDMKTRLVILISLGFIFCALGLKHVYETNHNPLLVANTKTIDSTKISYQKLFDKSWLTIRNEYYDATFNHQLWRRWKNHYHGKIKTEADAKVAIETMLESLNDPYSRYLTKEDFEEQNTSIVSKISGIGVNINNTAGKTQIISVIDDTPAKFADLRPGDIILSVDDKKISGMSLAQVSNLVKGPENTFVSLDLLRSGKIINKKIIRKEIKIKTVRSANYKDIGYIQILSFISNSTPNEFLEALENTQDMKGLIIDLRGNTGGLLTNAVFIANLFIKKGRLVSIVGRNGYKYDIMAENSNINIDKPIVILVNRTSASASEILSGALKDYNKAKIVGTNTFGKGMVQKIIPMPNKTGLNLTIAKYLTPKGNDINKKGIHPDIIFDIKQNKKLMDKDVQLEKAQSVLNKMIADKSRLAQKNNK